MKIAVRPVYIVAQLQSARLQLVGRCAAAAQWIGSVAHRCQWSLVLDVFITLGFCILILCFTWIHQLSFALGESAALVLWLLIIHRWHHTRHDDDSGGSDGKDGDNDLPAPNDPSPTGAAADAWLREQQRQALQNGESN